MAFHEHIADFAGKPAIEWQPGLTPLAPEAVAYRLALSWDEIDEGGRWVDSFARFLAEPFAARATGLIVGAWEQAYDTKEGTIAEIVAAIADASVQLPRLEAIFFGDIISEENEISWIEQGDLGPILAAYPQLTTFVVRGGNGLRLPNARNEHLETLIIQTGGLPRQALADLLTAQLPTLRHLELWLGTENYGGDITVDALAPLLSGALFPRLTYLGLRDSEIADQLAAAVATAPILDRLAILDLSLGTLTDDGAAALLTSPGIARLQKLDLHHHFCSEAMVARLMDLPPDVDTSETQEPERYDGKVYRYIAVSE